MTYSNIEVAEGDDTKTKSSKETLIKNKNQLQIYIYIEQQVFLEIGMVNDDDEMKNLTFSPSFLFNKIQNHFSN